MTFPGPLIQDVSHSLAFVLHGRGRKKTEVKELGILFYSFVYWGQWRVTEIVKRLIVLWGAAFGEGKGNIVQDKGSGWGSGWEENKAAAPGSAWPRRLCPLIKWYHAENGQTHSGAPAVPSKGSVTAAALCLCSRLSGMDRLGLLQWDAAASLQLFTVMITGYIIWVF